VKFCPGFGAIYCANLHPSAARAFLKDLTEKLFKLAQNGVTGFSREWISPDLRAFPYRERCFYFRIIDDAMIVVRVLHGKQDVTAQDFFYNSK
jgi:toxin ParE1/3/4